MAQTLLATRPDDHTAIDTLLSWIVTSSLDNLPVAAIVGGACDRLVAAGVPLARVNIGVSTLHPQVKAYGFLWEPGQSEAESEAFLHADSATDAWKRSPFRHMAEGEIPEMRQRLDGNDDLPFLVFEEFRAAGLTDWVALAAGFGFDETRHALHGLVSSWATDRTGGFRTSEVATLRTVAATLALAIKSASAATMARNVLRAYVGGDAAMRILAGEIHRGSVVDLDAVLIFADLTGFSALADALAGADLVKLLDDYLDCMGAPVEARGGQILKFMGDGLLATFPLGGDRFAAADAAMRAAHDAAIRVDSFNADRRAANLPWLGLDIAIHVGRVAYGNVGTAERLDFTAIGPSVNEVVRMEGLCGALGRRLLLSSDVAAILGNRCLPLESLGYQTLRGIPTPREIFTIRDPLTARTS